MLTEMRERFAWFASHPDAGRQWCSEGFASWLVMCEAEQAARKDGYHRAAPDEGIGCGRNLPQGARGGESGEPAGRDLFV